MEDDTLQQFVRYSSVCMHALSIACVMCFALSLSFSLSLSVAAAYSSIRGRIVWMDGKWTGRRSASMDERIYRLNVKS